MKSGIEAERNRTQWAPSTEESPPGRGAVLARRLREPMANIQNHGEDHRHVQPSARSYRSQQQGLDRSPFHWRPGRVEGVTVFPRNEV
ncbi:hypothetical protein EYF80_038062 [Liparis tanakae]|uniref:Uncharacterized protein n=1 Tax=Liparis tanakae TaxID=230148 RepID=A0A4Z2GGC2_9TELE|nr:hypothetical protein EYF80_038062 [Liparis tanakae]